jgi:hypothetical protein
VASLKEQLINTENELKKERSKATLVSLKEGPISEGQDETMSTSTISKAEEQGRMADVDASMEERYSKLKLVAIKLKKKTLEQEKQIKALEEQANASSKVATLMRNFESLQRQNDEQGDVIDEQKGRLSALNKDLEAAVGDCVQVKERAAKLEEELNAAKRDLLGIQEKEKKFNAQETVCTQYLGNTSGVLALIHDGFLLLPGNERIARLQRVSGVQIGQVELSAKRTRRGREQARSARHGVGKCRAASGRIDSPVGNYARGERCSPTRGLSRAQAARGGREGGG